MVNFIKKNSLKKIFILFLLFAISGILFVINKITGKSLGNKFIARADAQCWMLPLDCATDGGSLPDCLGSSDCDCDCDCDCGGCAL